VTEDEGVRGPALLLAATVAIVLAAAVVLALPGRRDDGGFERLVHGLGLGAATDLSRCAAAFDPRDGGACSLRHDPVPCGSLFCPVHD
jgi:hypothetical protein